MIDDGIDPLCELVTVCNPYHGKYRKDDAMFYSRSNVPVPALVADAIAYAKSTGEYGADAHLVDFSMPVLTTPQEWLDLGLEMWNKAVLFGRAKYYSIKSNWNFGRGGWPYRASDGTVWHMQARTINSTTIGIYADQISMLSTEPTTLVASFNRGADLFASTVAVSPFADKSVAVIDDYSHGADSLVTANFDPTGGSKAALHCYNEYMVPACILEVVVSGGTEASAAPPSVSGSFTFTTANIRTNTLTGAIGTESHALYSPRSTSDNPAANSSWGGSVDSVVETAPFDGLHFSAKGNLTCTATTGGSGLDPYNLDIPSAYVAEEITVLAVSYTKTGARKVIKYKKKDSIVHDVPFSTSLQSPLINRYSVRSENGSGGPWLVTSFHSTVQEMQEALNFRYTSTQYEGLTIDDQEIAACRWQQQFIGGYDGKIVTSAPPGGYSHQFGSGGELYEWQYDPDFGGAGMDGSYSIYLPNFNPPYGNANYSTFGKVFRVGNGIGVGYAWAASDIGVRSQTLFYCTPDYQQKFGWNNKGNLPDNYPRPVNPDSGEYSNNITVVF